VETKTCFALFWSSSVDPIDICIDKLFNYCEQNNFTVEDLCELRKFKDKIENNINSALTQKKIVDVFSKVSLNKD
jgi:hypothetical protein